MDQTRHAMGVEIVASDIEEHADKFGATFLATAGRMGVDPASLAFLPIQQVIDAFKADPETRETADDLIRSRVIMFCRELGK